MTVINKVLETERLMFQPFAKYHQSDAYIGWLNDKELMRYSEQRHLKHTHQSTSEYLAQTLTDKLSLWALITKDGKNSQHIGNISLSFDWANGLADIGLLIGESKRSGQGYGREAWNAVLHYALGLSGIRKVTGGCLESNKPMIKIMKSCEMREDGRRPRHFLISGLPTDVVYFACEKR